MQDGESTGKRRSLSFFAGTGRRRGDLAGLTRAGSGRCAADAGADRIQFGTNPADAGAYYVRSRIDVARAGAYHTSSACTNTRLADSRADSASTAANAPRALTLARRVWQGIFSDHGLLCARRDRWPVAPVHPPLSLAKIEYLPS